MNIKKYIYGGLLCCAGLALTGCQTDYDAPDLQVPEATLEANTTIMELKNMIKDSNAMLIPEKDPATGEHYVIRGRVISSDVSGNIFKTLVIQDETAALTLSVNSASLYTTYRVGQEVLFDATGVYGGAYNKLLCLGWIYDNYGSFATSRMDPVLFNQHTQLNGMPVEQVQYVRYDKFAKGEPMPTDKPYCIIYPDLNSFPGEGTEEFYRLQSQLVEIPNVSWENAGKIDPATGEEYVFAPNQENTNRTLIGKNGGTLTVRNSGYSQFSNTKLPTGTGTVRGILSYYTTSDSPGWQLLIRDMDDVQFSDEGTAADPYDVPTAISMNNNGLFGWVEGYIVGSVKAGKTSVTSDADIIFGADAELDNTLVIAADPDCTDYSKCMVVELPSGTPLRRYGNLADNPGNYKKKMKVSGYLSEYLHTYGVIDCEGAINDFLIDGMEIRGTEAHPYTVADVIAAQDPETNVWVEGYIVGFVNGTSYLTGAQFNADAANMTNYGGNNVILAASPDVKDAGLAIPVNLKGDCRKELGLKANPDKLGKKVKFRCDIGTYLGAPGVNNTEAFVLE